MPSKDSGHKIYIHKLLIFYLKLTGSPEDLNHFSLSHFAKWTLFSGFKSPAVKFRRSWTNISVLASKGNPRRCIKMDTRVHNRDTHTHT